VSDRSSKVSDEAVSRPPASEAPPFLLTAVLAIGGVGIAFEIALVRIFSIAQWHHFAYMIISMALLGFAASGTALGLLRNRIIGREATLFRTGALMLPLSLVGCYELSQSIPFETLQLATQPRQVLHLFSLYAVLSVPFFLTSWCIALGFLLRPATVGRVYYANLLGSGLGAALVVAALFILPAHGMPYLLAAVASGVFLLAGRRLPEAEIVAETESPLSRLTAVRSPLIRETPGQIAGYSVRSQGALPEQIGMFFDGGSISPIHRFEGSVERFAFLDHVTSALPYRLVASPEVLVVGAGGGTEVLSALYHGAAAVTAVELDAGVAELVASLAPFAGGLYGRPDVELVTAEGRGFLASRKDETYDVIQISLLDAFTASSAGVYALSESYLYTTEAISLYLDRLTGEGVLSITRWLKTPPRDAIKLFATVVEACRLAGLEPAAHVAFIRSWNTATIVVSRATLDDPRVELVREFAESRGFDRVYHPGLDPAEVNRYTVLEGPVYYQSALRILSAGSESFFADYPFHVRPATDDRPYFFRFFRWRSLPTLVGSAGRDWVYYVEWGYLVLVATVAQAALASLLLVLLPLWLLLRRRPGAPSRGAVSCYFALLGLAYMFLEIAFIQKMMLFLSHPLYAVGVVLAAFLFFSGLGSLWADRHRRRQLRRVGTVVALLAVLSALYLVVLPSLFNAWAGWTASAKVVASLATLAPMAFLMGIPFPTGLQTVADRADVLVPWAWGVNGAASVVGATLATTVAVHAGFRVVVITALLCYGAALLPLRGLVTE
jgi:spermidine synthase